MAITMLARTCSRNKNHHGDRDRDFVLQGMRQRGNRFVDQLGAVVDAVDLDAVQLRLQGDDLLLDSLDHIARILAVAHHDHAANRLLAIEVECSAAKRGARLYLGEVANTNRHSLAREDNRVFNLLKRFCFGLPRSDKAHAADDELHAARFNGLGAHLDVRLLTARDHLAERMLW